MPNVSRLSVDLCRISGTLPKLPSKVNSLIMPLAMSGTLPQQLGHTLNKFEFSNARLALLSGTLPDDMGANVETLTFFGVQLLSGTTPAVLGWSTRLESLKFGEVLRISGTMPLCTGPGNVPNPWLMIYLHSTRISGTIQHCTVQATTISLFNTKLSGSVPEEMWSCQRCQENRKSRGMVPVLKMNIGRTFISGTISNSLQPVFEYIDLNSGISGTVPIAAVNATLHCATCKMGKRELYFSNTSISGSFPELLGSDAFTTMLLFDTGLSGTLPNMTDQRHLETLYLHNTHISGSLPDIYARPALSSWTLTQLSASNTLVSGSIPTSFSKLTDLTTFLVYGNSGLNGNLDEFIASWTKLQHFIAFGCDFSGSIPSNLSSSMLTLLVQGNALSGNSNFLGSPSALKSLDLSNNMMSGSIVELPTTL